MTDVGKKGKKLRKFIILTETNLENKTHNHYELNPDTDQLSIIKTKCKQCETAKPLPPSSNEEIMKTTSTTSTITTITTTSHNDEEEDNAATCSQFDPEWLTEKDRAEMQKMAFEEPGHYRRMVQQETELLRRTQSNQMNTLTALRIQNTTRVTIEERIEKALSVDEAFVNLNAFLIMCDGSFRPFNVKQGGCLYELIHNKRKARHIEKGQLFVDMVRHPIQLKQLRYMLKYLDDPPKEKVWRDGLAYIIYKRRIELVADRVIDQLEFWEHILDMFTPNVEGVYYSIIAFFGLPQEEK